MQRLQRLQKKTDKLIVGLISGTSLDGVDAAVVRIRHQGLQTKIELIYFKTCPYPDELKEKLLDVSTPGRGCIDEICVLNAVLGEIFAASVQEVLREASLDAAQVDLVGSHGQTVHHMPSPRHDYSYETRSTLQLGEPAIIAKRTGIITVADFRQADMAVGGEGAPLVPYFDYLLFQSPEINRILLNLGGIANLTALPRNSSIDQVQAFDTGPANMVIDEMMQRLFNKSFDENGQIANSGQISKALLEKALEHEFFTIKPPKSTGREEFGTDFCTKFMEEAQKLNLDPKDIVATAAELTAESVWASYERFVAADRPPHELVVSGGGARNSFIMDSLSRKFEDVTVRTVDEFGIASEAKEAVCFAVLANETVSGNSNNVPKATGASEATIMGKICL